MTEERLQEIERDIRCDVRQADGWTTSAQSQCRELIAEVRRLREVLERYGDHEAHCRWMVGDGPKCNCGLDLALNPD